MKINAVPVQAELVSGTSIKTINSTSLLGSGDIVIAAQGIQGTTGSVGSTGSQGAVGSQGTTGINGTNGSQGTQGIQGTRGTGSQGFTGIQGLTGVQGTQGIQGLNGLFAAQGVQGTTGANGPGGGLHIPTKPITGFAYTNAIALGTNTWGIGSGTTYLSLFMPINTITVSALSVECTAAGAGAAIKILIYSDVNGKPTTKLIESTSLDFSTTGKKTFTTSYIFSAGTTYWVGYIGNSFSGSMRSFTAATPFTTNETGTSIFPLWFFNDSFATPSSTLTATSSNLTAAQNTPKINFISV